MVTTLQEMFFRTEADMLSAIDWLENNQTTSDDYEIRAQGLYPDGDWYYLTIWFAAVDPQAIAYYNGVAALLYDPWAEPPPEDPEDPPE